MINPDAHSNVQGAAAPKFDVPVAPRLKAAAHKQLTVFKQPELVRDMRDVMRSSLVNFVHLEAIADERKHRHEHALPAPTRVRNGRAISHLRFVEIDGDGLYVYRYKSNESKFKTNDLLVINRGRPRGNRVLDEGHLVWFHSEDYEERIVRLSPDGNSQPPQKGICTLDEGCCDYTSDGLIQAIHHAYKSDDIVELLHGEKEMAPKAVPASLSMALDQEFRYRHLTARQKQALSSKAKTIIIQGPPGSGKTHLLALMIEQAVRCGQKVLVSAFTHQAINNLLQAVAKILPKHVPIFKIESRPTSSSQKARIRQAKFSDAIIEDLHEACVIGATVHKAFKMHMSPNILTFDLAVIDEAGQLPLAQAMAPLLSAERHIIAGDHKQLPPIVHDPYAHLPEVRCSIFECLQSHYSHATITLDVTFRMNDDINTFPSCAFYGGVLKPSPEAAARRLSLSRIDAEARVAPVVNHDESVTFLELEHQGAVYDCRDEALEVADIVAALVLEQGVAPRDIAVVSAHNAQGKLIRKFIDKRMRGHFDRKIIGDDQNSLIVDTVDSLQGQEREIIVFSLCSSSAEYSFRNKDFLYCPNRLNVSITRSRSKLFIVGSKYFFPHINGAFVDDEYRQTYEDFYEHLIAHARVVRNLS